METLFAVRNQTATTDHQMSRREVRGMIMKPRRPPHATAMRTVGLLVLVTSSVAAAQTLAQSQDSARDSVAIAYARTLIAAVMEESGTPGMSVAVGIDGRVVWSEGFGYSDVENRTPVWQETKFRIGSVSKPVTAAAVGQLVEQGVLDLDAPVQRYVPTFPEKRWPITTRQVAGHLAGIRHYANDAEFLSARRYHSVLEGLEIFQNDTLLFEPGTRFSYSSYGWNLISAVVEAASGEDFLPYMQHHVFDRIGMTHTAPDYTDSIIPHRTSYYQRDENGGVLNAPYVDNSYKWAGGGFLSTPEDLVRFAFAHFGGDFLRPETVEELWTPQTTNAGQSTGYGIGWSVTVEDGVVTSASHGGGSIGGTTGFVTLPPQKAAAALVGNMTDAPTAQIPRLLLEAFLDPDALVSPGTGRDITGDYACVFTRAAEELGRGNAHIGGSPQGYWGRFTWDNGTVDRVVYSYSGPDETRFVTVDGGAAILVMRFTHIDDDAILGEWSSRGRGQARCARR
jgi:CubicO group peptidase (beta-lactamase class C family)